MTAPIGWTDIAIRLAVTVVVGIVIGYNRSEHGKAAGMRTTVLVCLAASISMIQVNLLLPTVGRPHDSFVMNDLMRFPLGILTGVGFIGGGAILRRDNLVVGVTTAATLWLVTVLGLAIGGGQIGLGVAGTLVGLGALWGLKWIERRLLRESRGRLTLELEPDGPGREEVRRWLSGAGLSVSETGIRLDRSTNGCTLTFDVRELRRATDVEAPAIVPELAQQPGVGKVDWQGPM